MGSCWTELYMVVFDLDHQGHLGLIPSKSAQNGFVHAISRHALHPGIAPTVYHGTPQKSIENGIDWLWPKCHFGTKQSELAKTCLSVAWLVGDLGSPNLHQFCIIGPSRSPQKMALLVLELQGHFMDKIVQSCQKRVCPCDNSSRFGLRNTNFTSIAYHWTFQKRIENDIDLPWPSRSFGSLKRSELGKKCLYVQQRSKDGRWCC